MKRALLCTFSIFLMLSQAKASFDKTDVQINEFSVSFFSELYHYIEKLQADVSTIPIKFSKKDCRANINLQRSLKNKYLARTKNACLDSAEPLSRFLLSDYNVPWVTDTLSIKRQIEIIAAPMIRSSYPKALASDENKIMADSIVRKVFYNEIMKALRARLKVLNSLKNIKSKELLSEAKKEIKKQIKSLKKTRDEGLANSKIEMAQIQNRAIKDFLYPSLSLKERRFLTMVLSAFMWRARGGGLYKKNKSAIFATQRLRARYVLFAYKALAKLNGWHGAAGGVGRSMGKRILWGWGRGHDMGTMNGTRAGDYQTLLERGVYQTEGVEEYMAADGFDPAAMHFSGKHLAYCYVFSWDVMSVKRKAPKRGYDHRLKWGMEIKDKPPFDLITKGPITWAEVCWGAALGLGISQSLMPLNN